MAEIEKAIKHFDGLQKRYTTTHNGKHCELVKAAIAALREKQARESGCDYCLTTWPNHAGGLSDIWHGNQLSVGYGIYREINYCPMCGKRLEVEQDG